ncbi:MAG TPA: hypothetical protein PK955_06155, partial [Methanoregulaceae archaeon]|nr:hypothetical protein [Methanoregulaceae archaeon]
FLLPAESPENEQKEDYEHCSSDNNNCYIRQSKHEAVHWGLILNNCPDLICRKGLFFQNKSDISGRISSKPVRNHRSAENSLQEQVFAGTGNGMWLSLKEPSDTTVIP